MGKGIDKFAKEIKAEVEKVKDNDSKAYYSKMGDKLMAHIKSVADGEYDDMLNQKHKSFCRCWKFIRNKAQKFAHNGVAFIDDDDVFAWLDEYVGLDDKAEVEEELKKEAESRKQTEELKKKYTSNKETQVSFDLMGDDKSDDSEEQISFDIDDEEVEPELKANEQLSIFDML